MTRTTTMVMPESSLFVPDTLLPSQFFATHRSPARSKPPPECRLLVALLEDALECFRKYVRANSRAKRRLFAEAEQWIMGENRAQQSQADPAMPAFSFDYVCEVLNIEPDCLRDNLRRWRAAHETAVADSHQ
jgi:hypothetical protein